MKTEVGLSTAVVRTVLAGLAEGATTAEILKDFPTLKEEAVGAARGLALMGGPVGYSCA